MRNYRRSKCVCLAYGKRLRSTGRWAESAGSSITERRLSLPLKVAALVAGTPKDRNGNGNFIPAHSIIT